MCVKGSTGIESNEMTERFGAHHIKRNKRYRKLLICQQEERQASNAWAIQDLVPGSEQRNVAKASASSGAGHGSWKIATQDRVRWQAASTQIQRGRRLSRRYSGISGGEARWRKAGCEFGLSFLQFVKVSAMFHKPTKAEVPRLFPARQIYPFIVRRKTGKGEESAAPISYNSLDVPQQEMKGAVDGTVH
ncbi:hypothetical protein BDZ91DRAFT_763916 [Kalaharituber pfeilii]|nr:hypothetical protein BDZ91DRAFT_763916 [Kalaharituber pfeilii]